jgi:1,4-alpha-glucan branching enzyme
MTYKDAAKIRELQAEVALYKGMSDSLNEQLKRARIDGFRLDLVEAMIVRGELNNQVDVYQCQSKFSTFRSYIDHLYCQLQRNAKAKAERT